MLLDFRKLGSLKNFLLSLLLAITHYYSQINFEINELAFCWRWKVFPSPPELRSKKILAMRNLRTKKSLQ